MDFDDLVSMVPNKRKRNKLRKFIHSPRFVVSAEVIGFSVRWGYSAEMMASILNIPISKYYRVIQASRWVSSSEYLRIKRVLDDKEERSKQKC